MAIFFTDQINSRFLDECFGVPGVHVYPEKQTQRQEKLLPPDFAPKKKPAFGPIRSILALSGHIRAYPDLSAPIRGVEKSEKNYFCTVYCVLCTVYCVLCTVYSL